MPLGRFNHVMCSEARPSRPVPFRPAIDTRYCFGYDAKWRVDTRSNPKSWPEVERHGGGNVYHSRGESSRGARIQGGSRVVVDSLAGSLPPRESPFQRRVDGGSVKGFPLETGETRINLIIGKGGIDAFLLSRPRVIFALRRIRRASFCNHLRERG